ncbi:MAG: hypothetical protein ABEH59_01450 [Halobacteriales archaeon]
MKRRSLLRSIGPAAVALAAGCTGSGGGDTPTATPTPPAREFPYTAASPSQNVDPRDFGLNNRAPQEYEVSVRITEKDTETTVLARTVTLAGDSEQDFEDIIGKIGTYVIHIDLAVGTSKRYEWPIDESSGDAAVTIAEGDSPTDPVLWYSIE